MRFQTAPQRHAQGSLFVLDASQSCGAVPMDVNELGADFLVCAGYKWLLSPYGTGYDFRSSHSGTEKGMSRKPIPGLLKVIFTKRLGS